MSVGGSASCPKLASPWPALTLTPAARTRGERQCPQFSVAAGRELFPFPPALGAAERALKAAFESADKASPERPTF